MMSLRVRGNEAREGRNRLPPSNLIQYEPIKRDRVKILEIKKIIHTMQSRTHNLKNYLQQVKYQGLMGMIQRNSVPHVIKFTGMLLANE